MHSDKKAYPSARKEITLDLLANHSNNQGLLYEVVGLPPVGLHELRHTFCTFLISAGIDLKTVQDMMGHSDSRMTMELYAHVVEENKKAASGAIGTYLATKKDHPKAVA